MGNKGGTVRIRDAGPKDRPQLRLAIVKLQEYERKLHNTRLPGEEVADAYLACTNPRKGDVALRRAPRRRKTATGMRQDGSADAQTEGQNQASNV